MLKSLKKIFYPISYLIHHFDDIPRDFLHPINALLNERFTVNNNLLTEIRNLQLLGKNEFFYDHLERLKSGDDTAFPNVSYGLKSCARSLYVYSDRKKTGNSTAICTVALGDAYRKHVDFCLQSHRLYAEKAGADYVQLHLTPAHSRQHPAWYKIALIFKMLQEGYDRVLFIDADALVTNYTTSLDELFEPLGQSKEVLLLAEDESGVNTGVMLVKRAPAAYRLLDIIWIYNLGKHISNWEQQALIDLMNGHPVVNDYVLLAADPKKFNSFPYEREHVLRIIQENNWTPGDFICHFSGIRPPLLDKMISYYITEYDLGARLELHGADLPRK